MIAIRDNELTCLYDSNKVPTRVDPLIGPLALAANIGLGWKRLSVTKALAYYNWPQKVV
jgi:hypothetical protein